MTTASARVASRSRLPDRPACPRCLTQFSPVVLFQRITSDSDVVVTTDSCKHTRRRDIRQRCGMPYAVMIRKGHAPEYLTAHTFRELEELILEKVGAM